VILHLITQAAALDPTTWTLHLPFDGPDRSAPAVSASRAFPDCSCETDSSLNPRRITLNSGSTIRSRLMSGKA
jgi:hypothetical protein